MFIFFILLLWLFRWNLFLLLPMTNKAFSVDQYLCR
jgi:hypothetical protein